MLQDLKLFVNDMKPQTLQTSNINNAWLPYSSWNVDGTVRTYWFIRTPLLTYLLAIGKTSILTLRYTNNLHLWLQEDDATTYLAAASEGQDWLVANPEAEAEEIHEKREELEGNLICNSADWILVNQVGINEKLIKKSKSP